MVQQLLQKLEFFCFAQLRQYFVMAYQHREGKTGHFPDLPDLWGIHIDLTIVVSGSLAVYDLS